MYLYFVLGCIFLNIEVSRECALPFWWRDQLRFAAENPDISLKPRTAFRYRSTIHRTDPNNFVHVQEYSQFTWWEHDVTRDITNSAISKDGSINGISPGKKRPLLPSENIKGSVPIGDASINGMIPKGPVTDGKVAGTNEFIPGILSIDTDTNRITPGVVSSEAETNNIVPRRSSTSSIFNLEEETKAILNEITSKGISIESTSEITTEATRASRRTTKASRTTRSTTKATRATTEATAATTETTRTTTQVTTTTTTASFTEVVPEREPLSPERERNEKENNEVLKSENLEVDNDIEASDASKSTSELKVKEPRSSRGKFFGSWFGKRMENETEPCKVSETDIHSLRSMIEKMFSNPREHVMNADSKEKAREDILNKFRNYGLQVWTQNFTTPLMMNAVRHIFSDYSYFSYLKNCSNLFFFLTSRN